MLKSKTGLLFLLSCLVPYAQVLLQPHDNSLVLNFLALVCLIASTSILAYRLRFSRKAASHAGVAVGVVALYFLFSDSLQSAGNYLFFKRQKPHLEQFVSELSRSSQPASLLVSVQDYPLPGVLRYEVLPDGTVLFTEGGEPSVAWWGVAYSQTGKPPRYDGKTMQLWEVVEGHWYNWYQPDN